MGQAAGVPGRCLPHNPLASALAPNVFPFIAAPGVGAQRFAAASLVPVTGRILLVLGRCWRHSVCGLRTQEECFLDTSLVLGTA